MLFFKHTIKSSSLFILLLIVLILSSNTAIADERYDTNLAEGMDILSSFEKQLFKKIPNSKQMLEKIKETLPTSTKLQLGSSPNSYRVKTLDDLWDKITDKSLLFFRGKNGEIFTIKTIRVENDIKAILNHLRKMDSSKFNEIYKLYGKTNITFFGMRFDNPQTIQGSIYLLSNRITNALVKKIKEKSKETYDDLDEKLNRNLPIDGLNDNSSTPTYDTTKLDTAFKAMEGWLISDKALFDKMDTACGKLGTKTDIIDKRLEILREPFPLPNGWEVILHKEKDKLARMYAVNNDFIDFGREIRKHSNKACIDSQSHTPDLVAINTSITNMINIDKLSYQSITFLQTLFSELKTSLATPLKSIPVSYQKQLESKKDNGLRRCQAFGMAFENWYQTYSKSLTNKALINLFLEVKNQLQKAKLANYTQLSSYETRLQNAISLRDKTIKIKNRYIKCKKMYDFLKSECNTLKGELEKKLQKTNDKVSLMKKQNAQKRPVQLTSVNQTEIVFNKIIIAISTFVNDAKRCQKNAKTKSNKLIFEASAIKASCDKGINSANITKLKEPRFLKIPNIGKKIANLRKVNNALTQEEINSNDAVTAYRNGKLDKALTALDKAQAALKSIGLLVQCPTREAKINTRKAKIMRFKTALSKVESAISGCRREELKKVVALYGKDTHPVLKKKISHAREQLQLLKKFLEAGDAFRDDKIDRFMKIMHEVNGKGAPLSCTRLDKKAQRNIQMIIQAKKDKAQIPRLTTMCDMNTLRRLQKKYRKESKVITLAKEIYLQTSKAIKDCEQKNKRQKPRVNIDSIKPVCDYDTNDIKLRRLKNISVEDERKKENLIAKFQEINKTLKEAMKYKAEAMHAFKELLDSGKDTKHEQKIIPIYKMEWAIDRYQRHYRDIDCIVAIREANEIRKRMQPKINDHFRLFGNAEHAIESCYERIVTNAAEGLRKDPSKSLQHYRDPISKRIHLWQAFRKAEKELEAGKLRDNPRKIFEIIAKKAKALPCKSLIKEVNNKRCYNIPDRQKTVQGQMYHQKSMYYPMGQGCYTPTQAAKEYKKESYFKPFKPLTLCTSCDTGVLYRYKKKLVCSVCPEGQRFFRGCCR